MFNGASTAITAQETPHRKHGRRRRGKGAAIRSAEKFRARLEREGKTLSEYHQNLDTHKRNNASTFFTSFLPEYQGEVPSDRLYRPHDYECYLAQHPPRNTDRLGMPCYGPDWKTPAMFYADQYQFYEASVASGLIHQLHAMGVPRESKEYAILNNILKDCEYSLAIMDLKFENAENVLLEIERHLKSGNRKINIRYAKEVRSTAIFEECEPIVYPVEYATVRYNTESVSTSWAFDVECDEIRAGLILTQEPVFDDSVIVTEAVTVAAKEVIPMGKTSPRKGKFMKAPKTTKPFPLPIHRLLTVVEQLKSQLCTIGPPSMLQIGFWWCGFPGFDQIGL